MHSLWIAFYVSIGALRNVCLSVYELMINDSIQYINDPVTI